MLVAAVILVVGKSKPLNSFDEPVMIVVPVPSAVPNPIVLWVIVKEPNAPMVIPA